MKKPARTGTSREIFNIRGKGSWSNNFSGPALTLFPWRVGGGNRHELRGPAGRSVQAVLLTALLLAAACGELRPLPERIELGSYAPITYQELLQPAAAGAQGGRLIKVPAYFWEFLTYDPAMVRNYLNMLGHPLSWYKLQWFGIYGNPDMTGYFDLAALDPSQRKAYLKLNRLDHVMIYGEQTPLGPGLYLRVHHIEKIEED